MTDAPDGDAFTLQDCKLEPNDVSEIEIVNPAQADGDAAAYDVGDTQAEDNPTPLMDNPKEFGSAANPEGHRRSHRIAREYHDG